MNPTRGLLRGLRASLLAIVGFNLAMVAHVTGGGTVPGPAVLLLLAGFIGVAAVFLTRTRLTPLRVSLSLCAMQVGLHEAFMRLGPQAACPMTNGSMAGGMPMGHGGQPVAACATGLAHAGLAQGSMLTGTTMIGAHLAATAVMVGLLAYGEKVLWFLAGCVRPARWLRVVPSEPPPARITASGAPSKMCLQFTSAGVGPRGPPMGIART
jgi:hypothetical protein